MPTSSDPKIQSIIENNANVYQGQGKLANYQVKLHINDIVQPVIQPQRCLPYHMRKQVSEELQKLVEQDIIDKVSDEPTPWISPIVCTPKKAGGLLLCVDMREATTAIQRERHLMPSIADFKEEVNNYRYFSKLDIKQAYHQLKLAPESRYITTFSTHEEFYRYKLLNYGATSATEIYQNVLQQHLNDIRGVKNIADDVLMQGPICEAHD